MDIELTFTCWPQAVQRLGYFRQTVEALRKHLVLGGLKLDWSVWVELEGVPAENKAAIDLLCVEYGIVPHFWPGQANLGQNLNAMVKGGTSDYVLQVQDDWALNAPLDLRRELALFLEHPNLQMIRYAWQPHRLTAPFAGHLTPERAIFPAIFPDLYSDNPFLARRSWLKQLGPQPHDSGPGREMRLADKARKLGGMIAGSTTQLFTHIGEVSTITKSAKFRSKQQYLRATGARSWK